MIVQIYADDSLVYDSRLEAYELQALKITEALNKGGTAEFTMPPGHPAYNRFVAYRTIVEVYRDGGLRFRGRALYVADDAYNSRTITCEGELCFFQDAISRPYLYQDDPAAIFAAVVQNYNNQMDTFKLFKAGTVTVTDPNDYIRLESENAETVLDTLNKLLERCGGYFVFDTDAEGARTINWLKEISRTSGQVIEFGENLLDFSRSTANTELATGIVPYGAKNEETGERLTIKSVWGEDYLIFEDVQRVRGTILMTQTWDDVTDADNLRIKAMEALGARQYIVTSLELSALDLSYMDKSIDSFHVGDTIRVKSAPHGVDDTFQLTEKTEDMFDPSQSTIKLGKALKSLTAASVAGDAANVGALEGARRSIKKDYELNTLKAVENAKVEMKTLIEQTSESILLSVSKTYAKTEDLGNVIKSTTVWYYLSASTDELAGDTWRQEAPRWAVGRYMWTKTVTTYGDGREVESAPVCIAGAAGQNGVPGVGVSEVLARYYLSTSKASPEGGSWSYTAPEWQKGTYLWTRSEIVYTDGTRNYTTPVCDSSWEAATEVEEKLTEDFTTSMKLLADSISLKVSGSLGSEASIVLSVNGEDRGEQKIDMSNVREAFAGDPTEITVSAGKITFNSGTIIINSSKFSLSADGGITATDATITGEVTTIDEKDAYEKYTSRLSGGELELYYNDVLCGLIKSQYRDWYADNPGLAFRVEEGGKYLMFAHRNSSGVYVIDYYLNCGFSTNYDEMHIFPTSVRFLNKVTFSGSGAFFHGAYLYDNCYIKSCSSDGTVGEEMLGYDGTRVEVGSVGCTMMLRGTTVYLKNTSTTVTSDANAKNSIEELPDEYLALFDNLRPVRYKYNEGTSGRYHVGFIAQEVAQALTEAGLTTQDFAGYVDVDKTGELGLSYDEFIALLCEKIKRQERRIAALEAAMNNGGIL